MDDDDRFVLSSDDESAELNRIREHLERCAQKRQAAASNDASDSSSSFSSSSDESSHDGSDDECDVAAAKNPQRSSTASTAASTRGTSTAATETAGASIQRREPPRQRKKNLPPPVVPYSIQFDQSLTNDEADADHLAKLPSAAMTPPPPPAAAKNPPAETQQDQATGPPGSTHSDSSFPVLDEAALAELDRQVEIAKSSSEDDSFPELDEAALAELDRRVENAKSSPADDSFPEIDEAALAELDYQVENLQSSSARKPQQRNDGQPAWSHNNASPVKDPPGGGNDHKTSPEPTSSHNSPFGHTTTSPPGPSPSSDSASSPSGTRSTPGSTECFRDSSAATDRSSKANANGSDGDANRPTPAPRTTSGYFRGSTTHRSSSSPADASVLWNSPVSTQGAERKTTGVGGRSSSSYQLPSPADDSSSCQSPETTSSTDSPRRDQFGGSAPAREENSSNVATIKGSKTTNNATRSNFAESSSSDDSSLLQSPIQQRPTQRSRTNNPYRRKASTGPAAKAKRNRDMSPFSDTTCTSSEESARSSPSPAAKRTTKPASKTSSKLPSKQSNKRQHARSASSSSSSSGDSFAIFNEQELAAIDRRVQEQTQARAAAAGQASSTAATISSPSSGSGRTGATRDGDPPVHVEGPQEADVEDGNLHDTGGVSALHAQPPTQQVEPTRTTARRQHVRQREQQSVDREFDRAFGFDVSEPVETQDGNWSHRGDSAGREGLPTAEQPISHGISGHGDAATPTVQDGTPHDADCEKAPGRDGVDVVFFQEKDGSTVPSNCIDAEERAPEIHPSFYQPLPHEPKQRPIVHEYSIANRPVNGRRLLHVSQVFDCPVNSLWRNKFETFNQMQSEIAHLVAYSDDNTVVSAPTGAGKTAIFEMAMARFFMVDLQSQPETQGPTRPYISKSRKIVYVSPSKALCEERLEDWSKRLMAMNLGLEVACVTGDGDPSEAFRDFASAHLILTTPEKLDSISRRWTENFYLFGTVKLFLLDEVHLIADESRGCCLESVVCRMKVIQRATQKARVTVQDISISSYTSTTPEAFNSPARIVAISATLPNIADIACLLDANEAHVFDRSYRPVPLTTHVIGQGYIGNASNNQFRFWAGLDRNVPEIIHRFSKNKPTIVFCHSKANTEKLADMLAAASGIGSRNNENSAIASKTRLTKLQRVLFHGVGYHHAGLEVEDRHLVEQSFREGKLSVLCATSGLGMGVNLPAHLVVIKGTKAWRGSGSGYQDLDQATLLQMIGRAGRPGFDTSGTAVVMTDNNSKANFQRLVSSGLDPVVSKLPTKIDEVINAEISQGVIRSTEDALNWLKGTLFSIQLHNNPAKYGIEGHQQGGVEGYLFNVCTGAIKRLAVIGALTGRAGAQLFALPASHTMSHSLVSYQAMKLFVDIPYDASQSQVLKALVQIEDMHRIVRRSEKRFLREAHKNVKYKLDGPLSRVTIKEPWEKAFVLLQLSIGNVNLEDYTLRQETTSMLEFSSRMLAALEEFSVRGSKHGRVVLESLKLRRSLATCIWSAQEGVLNQLMGVGPTTTFALKMAGISSFEAVLESTDERIEKAAKRLPPFGSTLRRAVSKILGDTLGVSARIEFAAGTRTPSHLVCDLERRNPASSFNPEHMGSKTGAPEVTYTLVAFTDRPGGCLIYRQNVTEPGSYNVQVPKTFQKVSLHLIASLVGLDEKVELAGNEKPAPIPRPPAESGAKKASGKAGSRVFRNASRSSTQTRAPKQQQLSIEESTARAKARERAEQQSQAFFSNSGSKEVTPSPKPGPGAGAVAPPPPAALAQSRFFSPQPPAQQDPVQLGAAPHGADPSSTSLIASSYRDPEPPMNAELGASHYGADPCSNLASGPSYREAAIKRSLEQASGGNIRQHQANWKKTKVRQQKSQQRAFVYKKDNPFVLYKHDPNDAESYLDTLSSRNGESPSASSIIPPEGLKALATAYRDSANRYTAPPRGVERRLQQDRRAFRRQPGPSVPEVLVQKEFELQRPAYSQPAPSGEASVFGGSQGYNMQQSSPVPSWNGVRSPAGSGAFSVGPPGHHSTQLPNSQLMSDYPVFDGGNIDQQNAPPAHSSAFSTPWGATPAAPQQQYQHDPNSGHSFMNSQHSQQPAAVPAAGYAQHSGPTTGYHPVQALPANQADVQRSFLSPPGNTAAFRQGQPQGFAATSAPPANNMGQRGNFSVQQQSHAMEDKDIDAAFF